MERRCTGQGRLHDMLLSIIGGADHPATHGNVG
nr:MAG TPA: hypothetical protein [Caudoviricetes sp.]